MREIKFRGKRKGGNEWICGDLNHIDGHVLIFDRSESAPFNSTDWFEVIPETVGQFIGKADKNGVDIYEGDIVELKNKSEWLHSKYDHMKGIGIVRFNLSYLRFEAQYGEGYGMDLSWGGTESIEIIGSATDNPELLK